MTAGQTLEIIVKDTGRTDAILEAVADAVERRRAALEADPSVSTVTLIVRLDRGARPDVLYRTESRH